MMRATHTLFGAVLGASLIAIVAPARADEVADWITVIEKQPAGVDRAAWKEQRREAARKLAAAKDKRALSVFLKLAENETFDIIGEIAIEGLGALGDPGAVPVLERIANDSSRDRTARDLAKKSLGKLPKPGKPPVTTPPVTTPPVTTPPVTTPPVVTPPVTTPPVTTPPVTTPPDRVAQTDPGSGIGEALLGSEPASDLPAGPTFDADVLAASESLTFAAGVASLSYDTVRERMSFDLDAAGRYRRRLEREGMAWGFDGGARIIAARQGATTHPDPDTELEATSRAVFVDLDATADIRFYGGPGLYGIGAVALTQDVQYLAVVPDMETPYRDVRWATDVQLGLGGGYGRVLDIGTRLRLRQLERRLSKARALGRMIDDEVARKLQAAWWALRRDRTGYRQLTATVTILREAGVLLGEPLSSTTYELLEVLRDPSFDDRKDGLDVQLLFGEGYVMREDPNPDDDVSPNQRIEMVLLRGRFAKNLGLDTDVQGHVDGRYRILAPEDQASPWRIAVGGGWRTFVHGDHGELLGGLDVGAEVTLSDDGIPEEIDDTRDLGAALAATAGWSASINRASRIRLGADARIESGELFFGASLTASYGWLDAGFARSVPSGL